MSSWLSQPSFFTDPEASPQNMESVGETVSVFASPNLVQVKYSKPAIAAIYLNQFGQWPQETLIFSLIIPLLAGHKRAAGWAETPRYYSEIAFVWV